MDAVTLAAAQASAKGRFADRDHAAGLVTNHHLYLGSFTINGAAGAPTPSNYEYAPFPGVRVPLMARVPTTCELIRVNLVSPSGVASSDADWWQFVVARARFNGPPLTAAATTRTDTTIVSMQTRTQGQGGHGITAYGTHPMSWKGWDSAAAQLQEEDVLTMLLEPHGAAPNIVRLGVTFAIRERP